MADVAALVFDIDSSRARTAATDLAKVQQASAKLAGEWSKTDSALRKSNGQFASSVDTVNKYGNEVRQLAREFNPALNAVYSFQQAEERLNRAIALGVVSMSQKESALETLRAEYAMAATSANNYTTGMRGVNNIQASVGNQFAQLNDVVVTAWGGMNPALIGMQQGMQMVQGFAGQSIPQALATMKGAFLTLLSPMTLATVAIIAGGAALIQWGMSALGAGANTKTFEDSINSAQSAIDELNNVTKLYSADGLLELQKKYGEINAEVLALVENQRLLAMAKAAEDLNAALASITSELGKGAFNTAYGELEDVFKVTSNDAQTLYGILENISQLDTTEKQIASIGRMKSLLSDATDGFKNMSTEQIRMLRLLTESEDKARQLANSAPKGGWMNAAIGGVNSLIDRLRAAVDASKALSRQNNMTTGNANWTKTSLGFGLSGSELLSVPKAPSDDGGSGVGSSTGSSGGAELKAAEKQFQNIRELLEKESVFQIAEWEKRQAQLDQALAKNLLSETTFQTMKQQLQMVYFGAEFEQKAVQYAMDQEQLQTALDGKLLTEQQYMMKRSELQHKYYSDAIGIDQNGTSQQLSQMSADFAQMNSLAGGGYDGLLKAQKAFAAGSALINAYLAASQAMADPSVPYWMKIAAYAKVLAAGMGAVNAIKGGGSGGASAGSTATASPTKQEPTKNIMVRLEGPDYMVDMAESIMQQIYEQSNSGRVIISRDR